MPTFEYQARTPRGEMQTGRVEASSENAAVQVLQRYDLTIVSLAPVEEEPFYARRIKLFERVTKRDLSIFFRQLATLFRASVPLVTSLHTLAEQIENPKLQDAVLDIAAQVDGGTPFSDAIAAHPGIFSNFYAQLIKAGEASGTMDEVLDRLADYSERQHEVTSKVRGAMIYPAFVLGLFAIVGTVMLVFVIPSLLGIIAETTEEVPLITKVTIALSDLFRSYWHVLLLVLATAITGFWRFAKTDAGKEFWDRAQLRLPVFGGLLQKIYLLRFSSSLGLLVGGGVAVNEAFEIAAGVMNNVVYQEIILAARDQVIRGESIASALEAYEEVPSMVTQMVSIGEKTGNLDGALQSVSEFYRQEVDTSVDNLVALIEPILIVVLGIMVAFLIAGVLLPIYGSITSI